MSRSINSDIGAWFLKILYFIFFGFLLILILVSAPKAKALGFLLQRPKLPSVNNITPRVDISVADESTTGTNMHSDRQVFRYQGTTVTAFLCGVTSRDIRQECDTWPQLESSWASDDTSSLWSCVDTSLISLFSTALICSQNRPLIPKLKHWAFPAGISNRGLCC